MSDLITHRCWCSIEHAIPESLDRMAREERKGIYCPLGHEWVIRKSEVQKLREELSKRKGVITQLDAELSETHWENDKLKRKISRLEKKKPKRKKR